MTGKMHRRLEVWQIEKINLNDYGNPPINVILEVGKGVPIVIEFGDVIGQPKITAERFEQSGRHSTQVGILQTFNHSELKAKPLRQTKNHWLLITEAIMVHDVSNRRRNAVVTREMSEVRYFVLYWHSHIDTNAGR